jgi:hypothetical protein
MRFRAKKLLRFETAMSGVEADISRNHLALLELQQRICHADR